jgi:lambda family phage minor tail protein L
MDMNVAVGPETVAFGDITDASAGGAIGPPTEDIGVGDMIDSSMIMDAAITELVALNDTEDGSVDIGASGTSANSLLVSVATGDVVTAGVSTEDAIQFSVAMDDSVAGGFTLEIPVAFSVQMGDLVDAVRVIQPIETALAEAVSLGFGTDAQFVFPIPLVYQETVFVDDLWIADVLSALRPAAAGQALAQEEEVFLYEIDMSIHGLGIHCFTPHSLPDGVRFNRQLYDLVPIDASGFDRDGSGGLPKPKLQISNIARTLVEYLMLHDDLIGSMVTRKRTLRRYLDDGIEPDPTAIFQPIDIFVINRKSRQDAVAVEFELSPAIDQDGRQLPSRRMIRDTCMWRYRRWDGTKFDYTRVECPYTGTKYFDEGGRPVATATQDLCGKRLKDCRLRFGTNADLPYGGFPGAGKNSS